MLYELILKKSCSYGDLTLQQWIDIFNRIRFVCDDFKRYTVQDANIRQALEEMYLTKTLQRFEKMKKDERFIAFFESPITVNGKRYLPLNEVIIALEKAIPEMLYVDRYVFVVRAEDHAEEFIKKHCAAYGIHDVKIVELDHMTDGQATTCMLAIPYCDKNSSIMVYNIDTYVESNEMKYQTFKECAFNAYSCGFHS